MRRCTKVTAHRCQLGRHLPSEPRERVLPMPAALAALALAVAVFLASGGWRA